MTQSSSWALGSLTLKKNMADDFADVPLPSDIPFQYRQSVSSESREENFMKMILASFVEVGEPVVCSDGKADPI